MERKRMFLALIIIFILLVIITVLCQIIKYYVKRTDEEIDKVKKELEFYDILVRWVELKQKQSIWAYYFRDNGYQTVAIYGMREIGQLLYWELKREGINVLYAIDRNADEVNGEIPVIKLTEPFPEVDVIIVTASHYFDQIYLDLKDLTKAEIIPVEDVLWSISSVNENDILETTEKGRQCRIE